MENQELEIISDEFYVVEWETYSPNNDGINDIGLVITKYYPNIENYNKSDSLHDCKVQIFKCTWDFSRELVEEKYFVMRPEIIPIEIEFLTVTKTKVYEYDIHVTINGRSYQKKVNEEIYLRYQAGVYSPSQFVTLFAPELVIRN